MDAQPIELLVLEETPRNPTRSAYFYSRGCGVLYNSAPKMAGILKIPSLEWQLSQHPPSLASEDSPSSRTLGFQCSLRSKSLKSGKVKSGHSLLFTSSSSMALDGHIERILWTESEIASRVSELAAQISDDFRETRSPLLLVGVATGAFLFFADIVRRIRLPVAVDFVRVESYGSGTESCGVPRISCDVKTDVKGKHVILVEDIVDTGNTLSCLISHLESKGASSISVCTFLDKPCRRKVQFELVGEGKFYRGFECPDCFVVGYGMDFAELYRNLPYIGILKPEFYE